MLGEIAEGAGNGPDKGCECEAIGVSDESLAVEVELIGETGEAVGDEGDMEPRLLFAPCRANGAEGD